MSEQTTEAPEPTEGETPDVDRLPADHPLVRSLAEQKKLIRDLKGKASELDAIKDAQKTEAEKTAERITKAEAEVASVPTRVADALREHLVALHEIDKDDAELFLTATEPELLLKQVTRLLDRSDKRTTGNRVPREGRTPTTPPAGDADRRAFVRQLTGRD